MGFWQTAAGGLLQPLGGCSGGSSHTPREAEITAAAVHGRAAIRGTRVDVTVNPQGVHPVGEADPGGAGAPVTVVIHATTAGDLHVHSSPAQRIAYPRGESTATLRLARPGLVDVESHQLDKLDVQLEVR